MPENITKPVIPRPSSLPGNRLQSYDPTENPAMFIQCKALYMLVESSESFTTVCHILTWALGFNPGHN